MNVQLELDKKYDDKMNEGRPQSVSILDDDDVSINSEITFQSVKKSITMKRLLQLMHEDLHEQAMDQSNVTRSVSNSLHYPRRKTTVVRHQHQRNQSQDNCLQTTTTRRHTMPPTSIHNQSRSDEINTIIELKLQVAQQMETIDRLSSDLSLQLTEKEALLSKVKPPPKPMLKVASLMEEKAHSDNTKSLHQQYNELQDKMTKLQKTMELQKEQMTALEADNERLTNESDSFQRKINRMSFNTFSSSSTTDPLRESEYTANTVLSSELSEFELATPDADDVDVAHLRRGSKVDQSLDELMHERFLCWMKNNLRSSDTELEKSDGRVEDLKHVSSHKEEKKNGWFISDQSERSFLSKIFVRKEETDLIEDWNMQVINRRRSMPTKMTLKKFTSSV